MDRGADLNLLVALDALLEEESVTLAAERLGLSGPAMSRTLGRIRRQFGDPVLVRAGRRMVPTPRALAIRAEVRRVVEEARAVFASVAPDDPSTFQRQFTIVAFDALVMVFGSELLRRVACEAPGSKLRFLPEERSGVPPLRDGSVDLEIGVIDRGEPEVRVEPLFEDRMVAVVRPGHPMARENKLTLRQFADAGHLLVSRRGRFYGPLDDALADRGMRRRVVGSAPALAASLFMIMESDAVGLVLERVAARAVDALGLRTFPVPLELPPVRIGMAWHPRHDADPGHAWLRQVVRDAVAAA
ncbi:LysR family transcriptional regulator [Streptomyces silvisoli]|uniref:LysR family transcriptional regulator n=1 Tax=Streptomyces silvisoli TaxID=3034235 RepID=A0ABT5ZG82_9ACTN|nr:LysR family transcriptional regulator [Streptomyces silvisoli]MDF3288843.1 LysR family transcriptional regulator [Streptomyces silvisoli]